MDPIPSFRTLTIDEGSRSSAAENVPLTLLVDMPPRTSSSTLKFKDHVVIGKFGIRADLSYSSEEAEFPQLLSPSAQKLLVGRNLGDGFTSAARIDNYSGFKAKKNEYFFKWLRNEGYFEKDELSPAKFICFGASTIPDVLQTPLKTRFGDWGVFAAKFKGSIFLWDEMKKNKTNMVGRDLSAFYGFAFEALMTGKDPRTVNDFEKSFVIQQTSFGDHRLLLINAFNGQDEGGDFVEVKMLKDAVPRAVKSMFLSSWAFCVVPGVRKFVCGNRSGDGRLLSIAPKTLDEIRKKAMDSTASAAMAYDFADRFLDWVSSHFAGREDDPSFVKRFSCGGAGSTYIKCQTVGEGEYPKFFPEWFLEK